MIILIVLVGAILFALACGGKFMNLGMLRFRWVAIIFLGFAIQLVIFQKFWQENSETKPLTPIAYLVSLMLLLVTLTLNHRIAGVKILLIGFLSNFLAIISNNGYMPVSPAARTISGQSPIAPGEVSNNVIGAGSNTQLAFLGDIFAIPKGFPLPNVFSIGDIIIAVGAAYLIYKAMTTPS